MPFDNLLIEQVVLHEVYRRLDNGQPTPPAYGREELDLPAPAMQAFRDRIISATGRMSQSMDMAITTFNSESAVAIAQNILLAPSGDFVTISRKIADKLTGAQTSRTIPGGVVAVFRGRVGDLHQPIIGIIKAELHGGFNRTANLGAQYLASLFMTPQTKLYKIGIFKYEGQNPPSPLPEGWTATIYDSQMSGTNREGAARYFFEAFLGCDLPLNAARLTKKFYQDTRDFIRGAPIPEDRKADLLTGLYTYMKIDQSPTVEVSEFAGTYLTLDLRDRYRIYMEMMEFPPNAIPKDTSEVAGYLRKRKIRFSRNILLTAPPEAFEDLVRIENVEGDDDADGGPPPTWTRITIRDRIRDQE